MKFPEFRALHLIQQRLSNRRKLPEFVYLTNGDTEDEAFVIPPIHSKLKVLAQIKIEVDTQTRNKKAFVTDLTLKQQAKNSFNYYAGSISNKILQTQHKYIFQSLAKRAFPNIKIYNLLK